MSLAAFILAAFVLVAAVCGLVAAVDHDSRNAKTEAWSLVALVVAALAALVVLAVA